MYERVVDVRSGNEFNRILIRRQFDGFLRFGMCHDVAVPINDGDYAAFSRAECGGSPGKITQREINTDRDIWQIVHLFRDRDARFFKAGENVHL